MHTLTKIVQAAAYCLGPTVLIFSMAACGSGTSPAPGSTFPTASALKGQYVLNVNGVDANDGSYAVAGVLTFDGAGKVTAGTADYNLGSGIDSSVALTGTYTAADGVAIVSLTDGQGTQDNFTVSLSASGPFTLSAFDGTGTGTLTAHASGFAPAGTYTYSLSGVGQDNLTSSGGFVVAGNSFTSGTETDTDGGNTLSYPSITGLIAPVQANGRGQAAIGGYNFSYYPVSANQIVLLGLDDRSLLYGTAQKM